MKGRILYEGTQMSLCYPCFSGSTTKTKLKITTKYYFGRLKAVSTSQQMPAKLDSLSLAAKRGRRHTLCYQQPP